MKNVLIYTIMVLIVLTGCQQTGLIDPDTSYREKVVVFANLQEGIPFAGVRFTRTLPMNRNYDIKDAGLKDVRAWIVIDELKVIPLHDKGEGLFKTADIMTVHAGEVFELFARYAGKNIYCKTVIPSRPVISSSVLAAGEYIEAQLKPEAGTVYGAVWLIAGEKAGLYADTASDFFEIIKPSGIDPDASITVRTADIPEKYKTESFNGKVLIRVTAYDKSYYDYFKSRSKNQQISNSFTQGGGDIAWNVKGEDVIGLFIGSAQGGVIKPK